MKKKGLLMIFSTILSLFIIYSISLFFSTNQTSTCIAWKHSTPSYLHHPPILYQNTLLVVSPRVLYSIDKESGACLWQQRYNGIITELSPVVGDICYLTMKNIPLEPTSELYFESAEIIAINPETGKMLWKQSMPSTSEDIVIHSDGVAISHELFLSKFDGSILWEKPLLGNPSFIEIEEQFRIVCSSYNKIFCFDVRDGSLVWKNQIDDLIVTKAVQDHNQIIVGTEKGWIYSFKADLGTFMWKTQTCTAIECQPMIYDNKVYISGGKADPSISCFDTQNGIRLWTYRTNSQGTSSPYVNNGKVYVGAHERKHPWGFSFHDLYCLDAQSGELLWQYYTKALIWSNPIAEEDNIYFTSLDKNVYRINESSLIKTDNYKNRK